MIYCDYAILGQTVAFRSPPENIDEAVKNDKTLVKIFMPIYDDTMGQFLGVKESVGYIMLRNEAEETFLSYGFSSEHSSIMFCYSKQPMPNIFRGTSFNIHKLQTFLENKAKKPDLCFYLPSITDRKEPINRYKDQVSLVPVTSSVKDIERFSPEGYVFDPSHLDQTGDLDYCYLIDLYDEHWSVIISKLNYVDKFNLGRTCTRFFKLVNSSKHMKYCNEAFKKFFVEQNLEDFLSDFCP